MCSNDSDTGPAGTDEIACTLTEAEAAERRETVRSDLLPHVESIDVEANQFRLTVEDEALDALTRFLRHEHDCCSFATFDLRITPGANANELTMSGDEVGTLFDEGVSGMIEDYDPGLLA